MTNPYYSSEQTELSRAVLHDVLAVAPGAVLIGGWGTWVRFGGAMSHDIDLIVSHDERALLETTVDDMSVSHHLAGTTWRATWRAIHLDLYVPFQSRLGANLELRVEHLVAEREHVNAYGVLSVPAHTATKIAALLDRPDSLPGKKDRAEILQLLGDPAVARTPEIIADASTRTSGQLRDLVAAAFEILAADPGLNRSERDRVRRTALQWASSLERAPGPSLDR